MPPSDDGLRLFAMSDPLHAWLRFQWFVTAVICGGAAGVVGGIAVATYFKVHDLQGSLCLLLGAAGAMAAACTFISGPAAPHGHASRRELREQRKYEALRNWCDDE